MNSRSKSLGRREPEKQSFAFGSSTPRDLSYLNLLPQEFRIYDRKLKVERQPRTDYRKEMQSYMEKARNDVSPPRQADSRKGRDGTGYAFWSSTPRSVKPKPGLDSYWHDKSLDFDDNRSHTFSMSSASASSRMTTRSAPVRKPPPTIEKKSEKPKDKTSPPKGKTAPIKQLPVSPRKKVTASTTPIKPPGAGRRAANGSSKSSVGPKLTTLSTDKTGQEPENIELEHPIPATVVLKEEIEKEKQTKLAEADEILARIKAVVSSPKPFSNGQKQSNATTPTTDEHKSILEPNEDQNNVTDDFVYNDTFENDDRDDYAGDNSRSNSTELIETNEVFDQKDLTTHDTSSKTQNRLDILEHTDLNIENINIATFPSNGDIISSYDPSVESPISHDESNYLPTDDSGSFPSPEAREWNSHGSSELRPSVSSINSDHDEKIAISENPDHLKPSPTYIPDSGFSLSSETDTLPNSSPENDMINNLDNSTDPLGENAALSDIQNTERMLENNLQSDFNDENEPFTNNYENSLSKPERDNLESDNFVSNNLLDKTDESMNVEDANKMNSEGDLSKSVDKAGEQDIFEFNNNAMISHNDDNSEIDEEVKIYEDKNGGHSSLLDEDNIETTPDSIMGAMNGNSNFFDQTVTDDDDQPCFKELNSSQDEVSDEMNTASIDNHLFCKDLSDPASGHEEDEQFTNGSEQNNPEDATQVDVDHDAKVNDNCVENLIEEDEDVEGIYDQFGNYRNALEDNNLNKTPIPLLSLADELEEETLHEDSHRLIDDSNNSIHENEMKTIPDQTSLNNEIIPFDSVDSNLVENTTLQQHDGDINVLSYSEIEKALEDPKPENNLGGFSEFADNNNAKMQENENSTPNKVIPNCSESENEANCEQQLEYTDVTSITSDCPESVNEDGIQESYHEFQNNDVSRDDQENEDIVETKIIEQNDPENHNLADTRTTLESPKLNIEIDKEQNDYENENIVEAKIASDNAEHANVIDTEPNEQVKNEIIAELGNTSESPEPYTKKDGALNDQENAENIEADRKNNDNENEWNIEMDIDQNHGENVDDMEVDGVQSNHENEINIAVDTEENICQNKDLLEEKNFSDSLEAENTIDIEENYEEQKNLEEAKIASESLEPDIEVDSEQNNVDNKFREENIENYSNGSDDVAVPDPIPANPIDYELVEQTMELGPNNTTLLVDRILSPSEVVEPKLKIGPRLSSQIEETKNPPLHISESFDAEQVESQHMDSIEEEKVVEPPAPSPSGGFWKKSPFFK